MADLSKIQWTDSTYNPWHGCTKVSPGCDYCYMMRDKQKYGQDGTMIQRSKTKFLEPLKWKEPRKIFMSSWTDFFIKDADDWRPEVWEKVIKQTPQHTYQILTKRINLVPRRLPKDWGNGYDNVWLGVSVENQDLANRRIPILQEIPAKVRFLSIEPLIGPVDLTNLLDGIHWVIIGGESGNDTGKWRYRPCELVWIKNIIEECLLQGVPVFVKQLGTHLSKQLGLKDRHGGNIDEWHSFLQIREFPL